MTASDFLIDASLSWAVLSIWLMPFLMRYLFDAVRENGIKAVLVRADLGAAKALLMVLLSDLGVRGAYWLLAGPIALHLSFLIFVIPFCVGLLGMVCLIRTLSPDAWGYKAWLIPLLLAVSAFFLSRWF